MITTDATVLLAQFFKNILTFCINTEFPGNVNEQDIECCKKFVVDQHIGIGTKKKLFALPKNAEMHASA